MSQVQWDAGMVFDMFVAGHVYFRSKMNAGSHRGSHWGSMGECMSVESAASVRNGLAVVQVSASVLARIRQAEVALERQDRARRCRPAPVDASPRKVAKGPAPVAKRRELYQPDRPESTWDTSAQ